MFFFKQRMSSTWHHPTVSATFKSQNFFFWLKNKRSLILLKFFPYLLFFLSTKFWSNYIAWLYTKRTKLHTKKGTLSLIQPSLWSLPSLIPSMIPLLSSIFWNSIHFAVISLKISKLFYTSLSPLQKYIFLNSTITHYPSLPHFNTLKFHSFSLPKTHLYLILYFPYKISLLRKQHNP